MSSESQPRRIVVGVDRSSGARVALDQAARRAGADGLLIVAHVVAPVSEAISRAGIGLEEERDTAARELVHRLAGDVGIATETKVVQGTPAQALSELARASKADEIVVGSRGMGRFAAALGSVRTHCW